MKKLNKTTKKDVRKIILVSLGAILVSIGIWYVWLMPRYDETGIPIGKVDYKFVSSRPEATLYYPGAKIFQKFGLGQRQKGTVAFAGAIMTTDDTPEEVYAWYDAWLVSNNYYNDTSWGGIADTQKSVMTYSKNERERFEVAINDPKGLSLTLGKEVPTDVTVFEFSYIIRGDGK